MAKPALFIGSSSEGLDFARAVRSLLAQDVEVTLWNEGFFAVGSTFIESLFNALPRFDFAAVVLTPDDLTTSRDLTFLSPRDNALLSWDCSWDAWVVNGLSWFVRVVTI